MARGKKSLVMARLDTDAGNIRPYAGGNTSPFWGKGATSATQLDGVVQYPLSPPPSQIKGVPTVRDIQFWYESVRVLYPEMMREPSGRPTKILPVLPAVGFRISYLAPLGRTE